MLDENDLQAIRDILRATLDEQTSKSENLILAELERTREIMERKIDAIRKNLDELNQYYKITKLESDNTALLLQMVSELQKRVAELEKKTA